ncbi:MAG TPA: isopentenyl transferase family protein, partial [Actinomycetota bacterium]
MPSAAPLLALVGPTASGKTEAGIELAIALGAEICSVDSMIVYRGMDVGTAKPTAEQRAQVPHHLLDLAGPSERFSVARFRSIALPTVAAIRARGVVPMLVGGS